MITKRTVFVLGAGASVPYGLPSGSALRHRIGGLTGGHANHIADQLGPFGYHAQEISELASAFRLSAVSSIDAFLARRPKLVELGKLLIAHEIILHEKPNELWGERTDHWYDALWNALLAETHSANNLKDNEVRFVVFNYDRSLECFLHHATTNTFGMSDADAFPLWSAIPIIHVYGMVGKFHYDDVPGHRKYSDALESGRIKVAADGIKIIPESCEGDAAFATAGEWFQWAERVCFLGFSFDRLNISRLPLAGVVRSRQETRQMGPDLYASRFGLTRAETIDIQVRITGNKSGIIYGEPNWKNLETLREHGLLL